VEGDKETQREPRGKARKDGRKTRWGPSGVTGKGEGQLERRATQGVKERRGRTGQSARKQGGGGECGEPTAAEQNKKDAEAERWKPRRWEKGARREAENGRKARKPQKKGQAREADGAPGRQRERRSDLTSRETSPGSRERREEKREKASYSATTPEGGSGGPKSGGAGAGQRARTGVEGVRPSQERREGRRGGRATGTAARERHTTGVVAGRAPNEAKT